MRAVLFDVDGTILDTDAFIHDAFLHVLNEHKKEIPDAELRSYMGIALPKIYKELLPEEDTDLLMLKHRDFQLSHMHLAKAKEDAEEVLKSLKERGLKLAAVTTRSNVSSVKTLEIGGLLPYLETVVSWEAVKEPKPDPEGVLLALKRLDVSPEDAVMVGDSWVDIEAGRAAGTKTIGIHYGTHGDLLKDSSPDHRVTSLKEILPLI